jgi:hypothetical protein
MQPVQNNDLMNDLGVGTVLSKSANTIDMSFLDDLF